MNCNFIGGQWRASAASRSNINPSDLDDVIGQYAQADTDDARTAIDAARNEFSAQAEKSCRRSARLWTSKSREEQLRHDEGHLDIGKNEGAKLACGGQLVKRGTRGHFLSPALFIDATPKMRIAREQVFGPIACAIAVDSYEEALAVANDSPFGLSSGICTTSLKYATHFKRHVKSGMTMVNVPTAGVDYHVPFGGTKASSYGPREQGTYAVDFFTTVKTAYTKAYFD